MPVDPDHPVLFKVEGNPLVCRYLDLTKFISLLHKQSLFFVRADCLEDSFEGRFPTSHKEARVRWYQFMQETEGFFLGMTKEEMIQKAEEMENFFVKMRSLMTISSWQKGHIENALMWKSYCSPNAGIMIKTTYSKLINSLLGFEGVIWVSQVGYVDYEQNLLPDGNAISPFLHKQKYYSGENEVRLLHEVSQVGWEHDWAAEESQTGVYIPCDLRELIDEVIVAPFAEQWYINLIDGLLEKYGIEKKARRSFLKWPD